LKGKFKGKPLDSIVFTEDYWITGGRDNKINILSKKGKIYKTLDLEKEIPKAIMPRVRSLDL
jgi:hypothetical protein